MIQTIGSLVLTQCLYSDLGAVRIVHAGKPIAALYTMHTKLLAAALGTLYDRLHGAINNEPGGAEDGDSGNGIFAFQDACDIFFLYKQTRCGHSRYLQGFCAPQALLLARALLLESTTDTRRITRTLCRNVGETLAMRFLAEQAAVAAKQDQIYRIIRRVILEQITVNETITIYGDTFNGHTYDRCNQWNDRTSNAQGCKRPR